MDGTKADDGRRAVQAAARPSGSDAGESAAAPSSVVVAPLSGAAADKELDAPAAAADEVDDEQVERFYALLANIRAMRGVYTTGGETVTIASDGGGARKRLRRSAEPPWRPAFRLEDFEDDADSPTLKWAKEEEGNLLADGEEKPAGAPTTLDNERKSI